MSAAPQHRRELDDCWNRIGIAGDRSCTKLDRHIHCRNCEVYSAAARSLLDVDLPAGHLAHWTAHVAQPPEKLERRDESVLIFRSSGEWLALATARCGEVVDGRPLRTLPHRRHPAVLGLANVRGELIVCLSLAALLGLDTSAEARDGRLLIVNGDDAPTALRVDEVHGTQRFNDSDLAAPPGPVAAGAASTPSAAASTNIRAALRWRNHTIGVLDERALFARVARSLA